MRASKEALIAQLSTLDSMGFRTLNRFYLHPENKRCCSTCHMIFEGITANFHIKKYYPDGRKGYQNCCKDCLNTKNQERTKRYREDPHQFISARFTSYRNRAKNDNCSFNLTPEYLIEQWDTQKGQCFYTARSIDFKFISESGKHPHNWTPSLDRLDPNLGYIKGNVVWCAYAINRMKNDFTYEEFVSMCRHIVLTREEHS